MSFKKKILYLDMGKGRILKVNGYQFEACFSDGTLFSVGVYKSNSENNVMSWTVTDINTGRAICYGRTRVDAVKKFQDFYLSKLERMVFSDKRYTSEKPENWYETKTAEFAKLVEDVRS